MTRFPRKLITRRRFTGSSNVSPRGFFLCHGKYNDGERVRPGLALETSDKESNAAIMIALLSCYGCYIELTIKSMRIYVCTWGCLYTEVTKPWLGTTTCLAPSPYKVPLRPPFCSVCRKFDILHGNSNKILQWRNLCNLFQILNTNKTIKQKNFVQNFKTNFFWDINNNFTQSDYAENWVWKVDYFKRDLLLI